MVVGDYNPSAQEMVAGGSSQEFKVNLNYMESLNMRYCSCPQDSHPHPHT